MADLGCGKTIFSFIENRSNKTNQPILIVFLGTGKNMQLGYQVKAS
jgi:hypothetical protein